MKCKLLYFKDPIHTVQ